MALNTTREKLIWQGVVPIVGAIVGAVVATWFQASTIDKAQLADIIVLLKDPQLTAQQKIQALEIYREITDRPWSLVKGLASSLLGILAVSVGLFATDIGRRIRGG
jgi:uncharacterized membrane protein